MSQQARDNEQGAVDGKTYSTALFLLSWSCLIPEGKVFLDDLGRGDNCVVQTPTGSPLLAGCFRERQDHRTIVTVAHKGSVMRAGRGGTKLTASRREEEYTVRTS